MESSIRKAILLAASLSVLSGCNEQKNAVQKPTKNVEQQLSKRVKALQEIPGWIALKELWIKLDTISPKDSNSVGGDYMGALSNDQAQQYRLMLKEIRHQLGCLDRLDNLTSSLLNDSHMQKIQKKEIKENKSKREAYLSYLEVDLLCDLIGYRIGMFQHGGPSITTRMVVFTESPRNRKEKTTQALEKQIDLILTLKERKMLSSEEFTKALNSVEQTIYEYAVSTIIQNEYRWSGELGFGTPNISESSSVQRQIARLDTHYEKIQKLLSAPNVSAATDKSYKGNKYDYNNTKEKLRELEEIRPALKELIAELQR